MNQIINLQIPIRTDLRDQALAGAKSLGFTNLQDIIRVFLKQLANGKVDFIFGPNLVIKNKK